MEITFEMLASIELNIEAWQRVLEWGRENSALLTQAERDGLVITFEQILEVIKDFESFGDMTNGG